MVTTKLNLSMTEPSVRQIYAKQGDTGRVLDISLDQTPEDGTLRILRPDGVEVTSEAVTGGEVSESGETVTFESMTEADVTELTVGIEPIQDLSHGDPSPSNICPITGHDEVTVYFGAEQGTADETYTTSLGQTVYGGTLDMVTGQLVVNARYLTVNDFSNWGGSGVSGGGLHWVNVPTSYPKGVNDDTSTNVCSHAPYSSNNSTGWASRTPMYSVNSGGFPARMYVASASLADFRTEYATLQAVYKLAEPVEYQLTPQQIKTLVGTNNVWASSGDIVNIKFTYGGLLSELPSEATEIVGKCYCDVEQNGVSSMPFTLNVKKNERAT